MAGIDTNATLPDNFDDIHAQDKLRPGISFPVDKIEGRPANVEKHLANVRGETQKQLEEAKKIDDIFRKLEEKFGESFDRKNFDIKLCTLKPDEIEFLGYEIFTLWDKSKNKLLAYINAEGETLFDMKDYKPFRNDFYRALFKKAGTELKQNESGKWVLIRNGKEYPEGSEIFDRRIIATEIID